LCVLII